MEGHAADAAGAGGQQQQQEQVGWQGELAGAAHMTASLLFRTGCVVEMHRCQHTPWTCVSLCTRARLLFWPLSAVADLRNALTQVYCVAIIVAQTQTVKAW
jgi:hypothetical protein